MHFLQAWRWPGNVRELENLVERMVNLCEGLEIGRDDLPEEMTRGDVAVTPQALTSLQEHERQHVLRVVKEQKGNLRQSAQQLGISRTALYNKLKVWQVDVTSFRQD